MSPRFLSDPRILRGLGAFFLLAALWRTGQMFSEPSLPFSCETSQGSADVFLDNHEEGPVMRLFHPNKTLHFSSAGLSDKFELTDLAKKFCDGKIKIKMRSEKKEGLVYTCTAHDGREARVEQVNLRESILTMGGKSRTVTDRPAYLLRGTAMEYCIKSIN